MEDRHIDALRRIGQADRMWSRGGHPPVILHLLHGGGMESHIDHPAWDPSWATPAEQTIDDLGELGFLRVEPHHDKRRSFDLTMEGRERSTELRREAGMVEDAPDSGTAEHRTRTVAEESAAAAELEVEMFLARAGDEVFSADQLAAAVANPKFDSRAAVGALRGLRAAGKVEPHAGGWRVSGEPVSRYHVLVAATRAADQLGGPLCAYDLTVEQVLEDFVTPYQARLPISVEGRELSSYRKPKITTTGASGTAAVAKIASNLKRSGAADNEQRAIGLFFEKSSRDVTADYIDPSEPPTVDPSSVPQAARPTPAPGEEIFIVHGHSRRAEVDLFLRDATGRRPIILADRAIEGRTIIEKFEQESDGSGFAVVLLTADDLGRSKAAPEADLAPRARQNVILELGYFIARLGRARVVALYEEGVELPSDYVGVGFISFGDDWRLMLVRELQAAGFEIDTTSL